MHINLRSLSFRSFVQWVILVIFRIFLKQEFWVLELNISENWVTNRGGFQVVANSCRASEIGIVIFKRETAIPNRIVPF
jgi:hypothetical protein